MTLATVVIPTHDHASTLRLAVESVLRQTVTDLEVLILGDGVTDAVRALALQLQAEDERVRFLDFAKGPNHGEAYRHTAVQEATGEIIAYLCDDDLFMPEHLADMTRLLEDHDLAQCLNGYVDPSGSFGLYVGRLDDPAYVARLCDPPKGFNFIGITGTAHTRAFYDRAGTPWETTPQGVFPDQHQWRRMLLSGDGIRGTTSDRMTVIGLPTSQGGRDTWTPEERAAELERWSEVVRSADAQEDINRRVGEGAIVQLNVWTMMALQLIDVRDESEGKLADVRQEADRALAVVREEAGRTLAEAQDEAARTLAEAQDEAGRTLAEAQDEAARTLAEVQQRLDAANRRFATVTESRWWRLGRLLRPAIRGREA